MSYCLEIGCYPMEGRKHIPFSSHIPRLKQLGTERVSPELRCTRLHPSVMKSPERHKVPCVVTRLVLFPTEPQGQKKSLTRSRHLHHWLDHEYNRLGMNTQAQTRPEDKSTN